MKDGPSIYCVRHKKKHSSLGWKHKKWFSGGEIIDGWGCADWTEVSTPSFEPEFIKEGRKQHRRELLQPFRQGELSKEYVEAYPEQAKGMVKEGIVTKDQVRNAKQVWYKDDLN